MTFKNQKEEVIEIELTSYGKHLLSKGKFRPTFYAFFDDDVLYDAEYGGEAEEQNYAQTRILEETPRLRVQTTYTGLETEIEKQIEEARTQDKKLKDSFQSTKERHYSLSAPLGRSTLISDYAPSWDITLYGAEFEEQQVVSSSKDRHLLPIPQMNLEPLTYKTAVVDGALLANDLTPSAIVTVTEHEEDPPGDQEYFDNGNVVKIDHKDILIEVDELHTDSLMENYDIEMFLVETDTIGDEEVETLIPLSFLKEEESPIVNGLYVDYEEDLTQYDINPRCVEYYLDIMIDKAIDLNDLCRLGYRTDFSKRGHIRVACTGDNVESGQNMSNIYDPIDIVPPFGDDC